MSKLFEQTNDNLDVHTKMGILSHVANKLDKKESEVFNMKVWSVLSELCYKAYSDSTYTQLEKKHNEMLEVIREVIGTLEGELYD